MATADLISSFLSNEMSPERERQFLLSVAASDSLRLELKSHMVLDRVLLGHAQRARVHDAVRQAIFAEAGVTAAAPAATSQTGRSVAGRRGFVSRWGGRIALVLAAFGCFGAGYVAGGFDPWSGSGAVGPAVHTTTATPAQTPSSSLQTTAGQSAQAAPEVASTPSPDRAAPARPSKQHARIADHAAQPAAVASDRAAETTPTSQPADKERGLMDRPGREPQPALFEQQINKPTPEDRQKNQTDQQSEGK